ncbi:MAG: ABC transporter ATP-binding protein [Candidatus Kerfeldbacteria bacterium CG08_land_8_20_14_0_20_43_14]|uniref:ABC transporter ATP-binding protein n=1 Tax=Candidatus Kerfeldbacteria bacterium CG08_land_8_20_14_0_20_43_14 TaxID=2014246 RepID=A0A2H0YQA5_9BACT|nr:MAG: ABC transporter ATP-binding protein [Candidatus Kerfeldbacteria bacterium CG08_land_8_20_14_0_20_43_14]
MKPIIVCAGITKTFINGEVKTTVLTDVSFKIFPGEFVAITGPSGSGKSTLMHILGVLDSPTSGQYELEDRDVSKLTDNQLAEIRSRRIGFVFQAFNLLPRVSVERNVELPLMYADMPKEERKAKAIQALRGAGIDDELHYQKRSNQLSGGQIQRVAIARALVNDPAILLADEPTGNLDQKTGQIVLDTFRKLNDSGRTIILITHDQYVAEHASRIIKLRDGQIIEDSVNKSHRFMDKEEPTRL